MLHGITIDSSDEYENALGSISYWKSHRDQPCKSLTTPPLTINSAVGMRELHTAGFDDRGASLKVRFMVDGIEECSED
jgi:hypothetical protein